MNWIKALVLGALIIGVAVILYVGFSVELTPRETFFASILLTMFSITSSWLGTHLYSQAGTEDMKSALKKEHSENLRTYALKAAEKVQNLSSEVDRLRAYLADTTEAATDSDVVVLRERLITAQMMLETLRSMNDTFLSDWRGIIGEDLQKQEEIESEIEELYDKFEQLAAMSSQHEDTLRALPDQISHLSTILDNDATKLAASSPIPIRVKRKRRAEFILHCPSCGSDTIATISTRRGSWKVLKCAKCNNYCRASIGGDGEIKVGSVETKSEAVTCNVCDNEFALIFPIVSNYSWQVECTKCSSTIQAMVKDSSLVTAQSEKITKAFLQLLENFTVNQELTSEDASGLATELGISKSKVKQGFTILERLGRLPTTSRGNNQQS